MNLDIKETSIKEEKKIIGVQVTQSMYQQLKYIADREFLSLSDVIRKMIFNALNSDESAKLYVKGNDK